MITFTGDLFLKNKINIDSELKSILLNSEYVVTNFENVLENISSISRKDKSSCLTYNSDNLKDYLNTLNVPHLFSLANNHTHDLGSEGLKNTYNNLQSFSNSNAFGISSLGGTYKIINCNNKLKMGIITATTDHPEVMSIIDDKKGHVMNNMYSPKFAELIEKVKSQVDFLVLFVHWGKEYLHFPRTDLRLLSYGWIESGADLILGHHPHVLQGFEEYRGKKIIYSLGNYIFPEFYDKSKFKHTWDIKNNRSVIVRLDPYKSFKLTLVGTIFDQKKQLLKVSDESLNLFYKYSNPLSNMSFKKYHIFLEKESYIFLTRKKSFISKFKGLFQKHKKYGRAGAIITKLIKTFK